MAKLVGNEINVHHGFQHRHWFDVMVGRELVHHLVVIGRALIRKRLFHRCEGLFFSCFDCAFEEIQRVKHLLVRSLVVELLGFG